MAEYGAHITLSNLEKPSIFDVIAQESLLDSLYPAFEHVVKVLIEKYPSLLSRIYAHIDIIYFLLHGALQCHYLSNYGASFSENFYDLKRISLKGKISESLQLGSKEFYKSLATLTIIPYVRHAIARKYRESLSEEDNSVINSDNESVWRKLKKLLLQLWPIIHLIQEILTIVYYVRYLIGHQKVQSPLLHITGVALARLSEDDFEYIQEKSGKMMKCSQINSIWGLSRWSGETLGYCLQNSLEVGAFFLQFLDWFYDSNTSTKTQLFAPSPIPPPPQQIKLDGPNTCPICFKVVKQETVLSVSGYVYCYACILPYVRTHNSCPVTHYPATTKQLIRIFHE